MPADLPATFKTLPDSSLRLEPPSEFSRTASPGREPRRHFRPDPPLGFHPLQRFPGVGQPPIARLPRSWLVAPSGFRNLLTLCSAPPLPALFHAGPAPGVRPPELCSSRTAVRHFQRRTPHAVQRPCQRGVLRSFALAGAKRGLHQAATATPASRVSAVRESGTPGRGLAFVEPVALLGFASSGHSPSRACDGSHRRSPHAVMHTAAR